MLDRLIRRFCDPSKERWGNCYLAFLLYARHGGHIIITKSAGHPLIPHVAWTDDLPATKVLHFIPINRRKGWRALLHSPWFPGKWERRIIRAQQPADATLDSWR